tara:strand:+ start:69 stop:224 length:156 start_codon:yes stop_codon:yes gene_type:complete
MKNVPKELKFDNVREGLHEFFENNSLPGEKTPIIECFLFFDLEVLDEMKDE